MVGVCRMCGVERELRNSHIVPELCYLAAYNSEHRAQKLVAGAGRQRPVQKGLREYLLCAVHEQYLGGIENEFKRYWYTGQPLPPQVMDNTYTITGLDYATFKLFHLSILWRASVASISEFDSVNLGPYEPKIRQMLLAKDAGSVDSFPMFGQIMLDENRGILYGIVSRPQQSRLYDAHVYYMCYAGCEWTFAITEKADQRFAGIVRAAPRPDGTMRLVARDYRQINSIAMYLEDDARRRRSATRGPKTRKSARGRR